MATSVSSAPARLGMFLALVEAALFAIDGALRAGFELELGGTTFGRPLNPWAAFAQGFVALALVVSVALPAGRGVRAGRVMAAQVFAVIVILVGQVALALGDAQQTLSFAVTQVILFVLAISSVVLLGWASAPRRFGRPHGTAGTAGP